MSKILKLKSKRIKLKIKSQKVTEVMLCRSSIGNLRKRISFSTQDPITTSKSR